MMRTGTAVLVGLTIGATVLGRADAQCTGDCNSDGQVAINEVITCVNIGLETLPSSQCSSCDANGDGMVAINEIITSVNIGLGLLPCGETTGTPTTEPTPEPTEVPTEGPTATPTLPFGECPECHPANAASLIENGGHGDSGFVCVSCHDENLTPGSYGPGHRNIPACTDCHTEQMTHEPAEVASDRQECAVCHTPHGSPNLHLVNTIIRVPSGETRDVVFDNEEGKADGSFASASAPGTGLCEICHATTEFYNSEGTGEDHYTFTCTTCHTHARGFIPPG